ncbi:hypothetical protein FH972_008451 [Carpinus fangiana]|uniref:Uncharacterized protein n=1 Tax=Carpinus fangiana TaxID=176857 RepID=A0A5N6QZL1_9ROSI|nr:hypothetical protein FH972_008451 [Carpinus fangiana]
MCCVLPSWNGTGYGFRTFWNFHGVMVFRRVEPTTDDELFRKPAPATRRQRSTRRSPPSKYNDTVIPAEQSANREIRSEQEPAVTSEVGTSLLPIPPVRKTKLAELKKTRGSRHRARGKLLNFLESTVDGVELKDRGDSEGIDTGSEGIVAVVMAG